MTSNRPISNSKGICFSVASILGVGNEANSSPPTEDGINEIAIPCDINNELSTRMVSNAPQNTTKMAGHEFRQSPGYETESSTASTQQRVCRGKNTSSADVLSDCIKQNSCSKEPLLNVERYSVDHCFDKFKEGDISQTPCSLSIALSIPECQTDNNTTSTSACVSDVIVRLNPLNPLSNSNMSTDQPSKSDTGCSINICGSVSAEGKNCESECSALTDISSVHIKSEKVDEEYDAAFTGNKSTAFSHKRSHHGLVSKAANRHLSKEPEIISTVIKKKGKKKVRITVIRGEWRTPKEGRSSRKVAKQPLVNKQAIDSSGIIKQEPVSSCETEGSSFPSHKSLSSSHQKRTRRRPGPPLSVTLVSDTQPEASFFDAESISTSEKEVQRSRKKSAVPTALFRNYYIKTEVDEDQDTQRKESSDAEAERQGSSEHGENRPRPRDIITEGHGSSQQSNDVNIPSLIALHSGRDVRRRRGRCGVYSEAARQLQEKFYSLKVEQSEMRKCVVELEGLPASITTAGFINLKTDSKMLQDAIRLTTSLGLRKRPRDVQRPYECEQCGKRFIQKSHRSQHFKVHLGVKEHCCTLCGACFMYKSTLTSHQRFKHLGEKPYSCSICKKAFSYSSHLSVHMQRHYDERPLTCPICHKQYGAYYIVNHMKTHSDQRLFACKLCGAQLKSKKALELHEAVHEGLRPWTCSMCPATFPYKSSLILHERVHRGERPYCCDQCPATFTQSTHLRTHLKGVHKIENPATCRGGRTIVERVPAQRLDSIKEDAILLMRRTMSKVTKECKRKKILPISSAIPGNASGSQSSSDLQHSDKRPRLSSNHCVKKFQKLQKTNDSMEKVDIDGSVAGDGNRKLGDTEGHGEAEVSDNLVVKIDFIKHHNLRKKKI